MGAKQTTSAEKQPPDLSNGGVNVTAMNEALIIGSVRQHELTEAADLSNTQLQKEIIERKKAEGEIHRLNSELEQRVAERTTELQAANEEM